MSSFKVAQSPSLAGAVAREPLIALRGVHKRFDVAAGTFAALRGIDLTVVPGELVAVVGKSGSGKSTLLNLVAAIDRPSAGEVLVAGERLGSLSEDAAAVWRGRTIGIVFQFFQLLPTLTVVENVALPMDFCRRIAVRDRLPRALQLLEQMGVADQADKLPAELSGGQQQRVAIARACANDPPILVADEPTGNLDSQTAAGVLQLFADLAKGRKTVLMVTHERDVSAYVTRTIRLADGEILEDTGASARGARGDREACHA